VTGKKQNIDLKILRESIEQYTILAGDISQHFEQTDKIMKNWGSFNS